MLLKAADIKFHANPRFSRWQLRIGAGRLAGKDTDRQIYKEKLISPIFVTSAPKAKETAN
jgi:hypothetical protein